MTDEQWSILLDAIGVDLLAELGVADVSRETITLREVMGMPGFEDETESRRWEAAKDPRRPYEVLYVPPEWSAAPQRRRNPLQVAFALAAVIALLVALIVVPVLLAAREPASPATVTVTPTPYPFPGGWVPRDA